MKILIICFCGLSCCGFATSVSAQCNRSHTRPASSSLPPELRVWSKQFQRDLDGSINQVAERDIEQAYQHDREVDPFREPADQRHSAYVPPATWKMWLRQFVYYDFEPALGRGLQCVPVAYHPTLFARMRARRAPNVQVKKMPAHQATFLPGTNVVTLDPLHCQTYGDMRRIPFHELLHVLIEPRRSRELIENDHTYLYEGMTGYLTLFALEEPGGGERGPLISYPDEVTLIALLLPQVGDELWYWYLVEVKASEPTIHARLANKLTAAGVSRAGINRLLFNCQRKWEAYHNFVFDIPPPFAVRAYERERELIEKSLALKQQWRQLEGQQLAENDEQRIRVEVEIERTRGLLDAASRSADIATQAAERQRPARQAQLTEIVNNQHLRLLELYQAAGVKVLEQQVQNRTPKAILAHIKKGISEK